MIELRKRNTRYRYAAVLMAIVVASCDSSERSSRTTPATRESVIRERPSDPADTLEQGLEFCVSETNRYRASSGLPPLTRSAELEAYAAAGARQDGLAHQTHLHYKVASLAAKGIAENEIPWWPGSSIRAVIKK